MVEWRYGRIVNKKILLVFVGMILCMAAVGIYSLEVLQVVHRNTTQLYLHPYTVSNAVRDIEVNILSIRRNMTDITSSAFNAHSEDLLESINRYEQAALQQFDIVLERFLGSKSEILEARKAFVDWKVIREQIIVLSREGRNKEALKIIRGKNALHVAFVERMLATFTAYAKHKGKFFYTEEQKSSGKLLLTFKFLLFFMLVIAIGAYKFIYTQQKKIEQNVKKAKDNEIKYRELLDASPDAVVIVDKDRVIQIASRGAVALFGYSAKELVGNPIEMLVPEKFAVDHVGHVRRFLGAPRTRAMNQGRRLQVLKKNGSLVPVSISLNPVMIDGQQYVTSSIRDMTEQDSLEAQFRQAQKMETIGMFVGGIAHDFNNLLATISGSVFLAKKVLKEQDNQYLNTIEQESHRAGEMVRRLLAFARKGVVQKKNINLTDLLNQSVKILRMSATEHVQVNINCCDKKLPVYGDFGQLQQVLMNLVNNARDALHGHQTPVITVALDEFLADKDFLDKHEMATTHRFARLCVADNGSGIIEDDLQHIFEPFFTTKDVGKGTGLGLAMIDGTVTTHGGFIEVESRPGEGAIFHVYLPLLENTVEVQEAEVMSGQMVDMEAGEGQCILLVDDEQRLRETNCLLLESMGYHVVEADDGLQAIEQFNQNEQRLGLILMDVVMPKMGGITAAKRIRAKCPHMPIIFTTGYDKSQVLGDEMVDLRDYTVLTKPFTVVELSNEIKRLIRTVKS